MKANQPTTVTAIIITCIWMISLGMIVFDIEYFPFTPMNLINIGILILIVSLDRGRKTTVKEFIPRLLVGILCIGVIVFIIIVPLFHTQPVQPYRSILAAVVILLCNMYLWWQWRKARKLKA